MVSPSCNANRNRNWLQEYLGSELLKLFIYLNYNDKGKIVKTKRCLVESL